ncbi:MAG: hypothetical protein LBC70_01715 [Chitinispirillales bacterium]|nr:hypothetical protein [Chitinispirillales bacterium]
MNMNMNVGGVGGVDRSAEFEKTKRGEQGGESFKAHLDKAKGAPEESVKPNDAENRIGNELNALSALKNLRPETRLMAAINIKEKGMVADEAILSAERSLDDMPGL